MNDSIDKPRLLGQGFHWQNISTGQRFQTFRRTITETDLVNFISFTGILESIFIEDAARSRTLSNRGVVQ